MTGVVYGKATLNLLVTGTTEIVAIELLGNPNAEALFFPQECYAVLRSKLGGAVTTTARIRIGGNGTHDDVMPLFTIGAGAAVGAFAMPPLVAKPYVPPNLRAVAIFAEVERAAIGPTELTGDIMVVGTMVSG